MLGPGGAACQRPDGEVRRGGDPPVAPQLVGWRVDNKGLRYLISTVFRNFVEGRYWPGPRRGIGASIMGEERKGGWCENCNRQTVVYRPTPNHVLHLLMTILLCGLWLIVWIGVSIRFGGWRCTVCGGSDVKWVT